MKGKEGNGLLACLKFVGERAHAFYHTAILILILK